MTASRRSIGGEFELRVPEDLSGSGGLAELTRGRRGRWVASGRAALGALLADARAHGAQRVLLPSYLCDSMLHPVTALGMSFDFYPVSSSLEALPEPRATDVVVLVHYFGWMNASTGRLRTEAPGHFTLIEDFSQALFGTWPGDDDRRLLLSPRKFAPIPAGGWCSLPVDEEPAAPDMERAAWKSIAGRLMRAFYLNDESSPVHDEAELVALEIFREVEQVLARFPLATSCPRVALDCIDGVDWSRVRTSRRENWITAQTLLAGVLEAVHGQLPGEVVPLGYVIRAEERDALRARLTAQRIFCPVHWPLPPQVDKKRFPEAAALSRQLLTIPIDQRYTANDIEWLAARVRAA